MVSGPTAIYFCFGKIYQERSAANEFRCGLRITKIRELHLHDSIVFKNTSYVRKIVFGRGSLKKKKIKQNDTDKRTNTLD